LKFEAQKYKSTLVPLFAEVGKVTLVLMGWNGYTKTRDRIMLEVTDDVVRHAP